MIKTAINIITEAKENNFKKLDLSNYGLKRISQEIFELKNLTELWLQCNQLTNLPKEIGELKNLEKLSLHGNQLTSLPKELGELKNLTYLYLGGNLLTNLPKEIKELKNLTELWLPDNQLTNLLEEIAELKNLTRLYLYNNLLTSLPKEIGGLKNLSLLFLHNNQLTSLPKEISLLSDDIYLTLSNNPLQEPPIKIAEKGIDSIRVYFNSINISDCEELRNCSLYINKWLCKQPKVKEESLTDWLLLNISEKISGIKYKSFSRTEEARKTGADWEWWFIFNNFSFKFRVQAKKVKIDSDNYPSIAYSNKYGLQIDRMITDAINSNSIPLFAFYTEKCNKVSCHKQVLNEGVYMGAVYRIYKKYIVNGKKYIKSDDLLEDSKPLSCFLCCPFCIRKNDEKGFLHFITNYFSTEIENIDNILIRGQYSELPNYIVSFIEQSKEVLPDWWEKEYGNQIEGINSLLVYDARKQ